MKTILKELYFEAVGLSNLFAESQIFWLKDCTSFEYTCDLMQHNEKFVSY